SEASTLEEANAVLCNYLPRFNRRFLKPAAQPGSVYRPSLTRAEANARICFTYWRTVTRDHTISLFGNELALPQLPVRLNLAGRRVELCHRMDGRLAVVYQGQVHCLLQPAQLAPPRLEQFDPSPQHLALQLPPARIPSSPPANGLEVNSSSAPYKPEHNHPWRRQGEAVYRRRQQLKE
ncbi:MAG: hypothetical protein WA996_25605, partial [Candidatus Promineifilaceae bacterium]